MRENWDRTFAYLISPACEGFESQLKGDHGGLTLFGIASKWYPTIVSAIREKLENGDPMGALDLAKDFYFKSYWVPEDCNALPAPLDTYVFVEAVNTEGANCHKIRDLARSSMDPETFLAACLEHYKRIAQNHPDQARFLKGWQNRLTRLAWAFPYK